MKVAIPAEITPGETRVAAVPETVAKLRGAGFEVVIQKGAGESAHFSDDDYVKAGAVLVGPASDVYAGADVVFKVQPPTTEEVALIDQKSVLVGYVYAYKNQALMEALAERGVTTIALELLPRISRAQSMDTLSSQASLAGYKAVVLAASKLDRIIPMQMTAAGTLPPAKVFILGAGVAGLQAIATAKRLGAVVEAFDVRPAVKEEVQSLGAKFLDIPIESAEGQGGYAKEQGEEYLKRQRELLGDRVEAADIVITTAAIPGRKAPLLVTKEMVQRMRNGAVIVDLAADTGGNCEVTVAGTETDFAGVTVVGIRDMPTTVPRHASLTYSKNLLNLVSTYVKDGVFALDFEDEIIKGTCVVRDSKVVYQPPQARPAPSTEVASSTNLGEKEN